MNLENLTPEEQEQYNQFLQQFIQNIDPTDYLPPSVREIISVAERGRLPGPYAPAVIPPPFVGQTL